MFTSKQMIRAMMTAQAASDERMRTQNARNHEELMKTISETTDKEIKARNRFDISLDEYNAMNDHIRALNRENSEMKSILEKFKFPYDMPIDPSSINVIRCEDPLHSTTRYVIRVDCHHTGRF